MSFSNHLILSVMIAGIVMLGCACSAPRTINNNALLNPGVSLELAELRKQEITGLKYKLFFRIPEQKKEAVSGEVMIAFSLNRKKSNFNSVDAKFVGTNVNTNSKRSYGSGELLIDCRISSEKILSVEVNGKKIRQQIVNEHIIIPESAVRNGENQVAIQFITEDQSLNRNDEYLYTLLVPDRARTLFPCFEQPNLKAEFTLQLELPAQWTAVSNTVIQDEKTTDNRKTISFAPTEPLSTYLFSFVAGRLNRTEYTEGGRTISAYHRETDPKKLAQLDTIFHQVVASLKWLENYTDIPYPFAKYDLIILPGFQYGGMEHTGATLYNDRRMFLDEHPTPDEELGRTLLIAHETAHMWFGDLVTMAWFNDVWTKEVFANYFAASITEPLFPNVNHRLNSIRTFNSASLSEDRTPGTTAIRQPLDNLRNAGLIYGQIIYNKAPVVMQKLVEIMGKETFQNGIREYLKSYAYSNATWDDLIAILDNKTEADLKLFSEVWVNQKGLPEIDTELKGDRLMVRQRDPLGRGLCWPQRFNITLCGEKDSVIEINLTDSLVELPLGFLPNYVLPNTDGRGYGRFLLSEKATKHILTNWAEEKNEVTRFSLLMTLYENYLADHLPANVLADALIKGLPAEENPLIASSAIGYLSSCCDELKGEARTVTEQKMYALSQTHPLFSSRQQLFRAVAGIVIAPDVVQSIYNVWEKGKSELLSERDFITLSYELALRLPEKSEAILAKQRERITNQDRIREFEFIARSLTPDTIKQDKLFQSLLIPENRRVEPWTQTVLYYLNHPLREDNSVKYIRPALEALQDVQRTGDIFFPRGWVGALLGGHHSVAAYNEVRRFLDEHPDYPPLLKNKILQAAYPLYRRNSK